MQDDYWQVRVKAARSLGLLKAEAGLPSLVASLTHSISNLRKEAVIALGEIGDTRAIAPLETALADPDPDVRKLARLALTTIGLAQKAKREGASS
jgi:HEAT repeat protein